MMKAVIFDMYETLITLWYSRPYQGAQIAADMGIPEAKFREIWDTTDDDRTTGRRIFEDVIEEIMRVNHCYDRALFDRIVEKRTACRWDCFEHLHAGILPMLEELKARGLKIGLITNCFSEEEKVIRESILYPYFDVPCMSCAVGIRKPDPRIFELCMEQLGVTAEECLYCGDGGSRELEAASAAGMKAVQALWYLKEGSGQPVSRLAEFPGVAEPKDLMGFLD